MSPHSKVFAHQHSFFPCVSETKIVDCIHTTSLSTKFKMWTHSIQKSIRLLFQNGPKCQILNPTNGNPSLSPLFSTNITVRDQFYQQKQNRWLYYNYTCLWISWPLNLDLEFTWNVREEKKWQWVLNDYTKNIPCQPQQLSKRSSWMEQMTEYSEK